MAMRENLSRAGDTLGFVLGMVLVLLPVLYVSTMALHRLGLPSPAEAAGAAGPTS